MAGVATISLLSELRFLSQFRSSIHGFLFACSELVILRRTAIAPPAPLLPLSSSPLCILRARRRSAFCTSVLFLGARDMKQLKN